MHNIRNIKENPRLFIVSQKPPLTEEEVRLVYTATGFYPQHIELAWMEEYLADSKKPKSKLINNFFAYGGVMVFEHDAPFLGAKTQDFIETAKGSLIDFIFLSDTMSATDQPDFYSSADIRSLIPASQMILGTDTPTQSYNLRFFEYLQAKGFLAEQAVQLIQGNSCNPDLSSHQLFHNDTDYRIKYLFPSRVTLTSDFSEEEDVLCSFRKSSSQVAEGHIAFTREDIKQLQVEGNRAIFVAQNIDVKNIGFTSKAYHGYVVCEEVQEGDASLIDHLAETPGLSFGDNKNGNRLQVENETLRYGDMVLKFGDFVVLDTQCKRLITANASANTKEPYPQFSSQFVKVCDKYRRSKTDFNVCVNINHPDDVDKINDLDIDGIGLVRTEYFFLTPEKIACLKSALADSDPQAITDFQTYQKDDFARFFCRLGSRSPEFPVTVRLLDPKPSELLDEDERLRLKKRAGTDHDPRGVQIISTTPDLYAAQSFSVLQAAQEQGFQGDLRILVPFVSSGEEMEAARKIIEDSAAKSGFKGTVKIGAMLENFNALANIENIVQHADFANIGPKDLTIEFLDGLRKHQWEEVKALLKGRYGDGNEVPYEDEIPYEHLHSKIKEQVADALEKARQIKPDFKVIVCGDEIHESSSSVGFAFRHTQGVSVPINQRIVAGTKFIVCHHALNLYG